MLQDRGGNTPQYLAEQTQAFIAAAQKRPEIKRIYTTFNAGTPQIKLDIDTDKAIALIVNGFSKEVLNKLPMEFAVEAQKLLEISLEGSVG